MYRNRTTMDGLPPEITTNILSRLPIKSLVQCRCVRKLWYQILTDSKFPLNHYNQISTISPDILLYCYFQGQIVYLDDSREEEEEGYGKEPIFIKPLKMFDQASITSVTSNDRSFHFVLGSCNGLVCLYLFNFVYVPCPIYVLNPITQEYLQLPQYEDPGFDFMMFDHDIDPAKKNCSFGFGFEESMQVYKVVLVMYSAPQFCKNEVQIYTLGSNTWRRKPGIAPKVLNRAGILDSSIFVNGCLHWLTFSNDEPLIVSFNLCREDFGYVAVPRENLLKRPCYLTIGLLEQHLSIVDHSFFKDSVEIWVMKKYNDNESWVKQFSIKRELICSVVAGSALNVRVDLLKFRKSGELLLICNWEHIVSYNITSKKCQFFKVEGFKEEGKHLLQGYPFVGSLLSLKSACGMDPDTKETSKED